ncbi:hypothetical protein Sjap_017960 [Stephania japonica]|uniref:Dihydrolipoamide acetyltransferase component of pyruvate dehydrogenase complex n=1 Tax=Stephania japonica TaxID=461633 RepID=A0AAP0NL19_9MAGN
MVDLEGQDHGPSSSSVSDNDDDFIVYSKEGNNARWFKKEGDEVSAEDILCEVETVNATTMEGEDDIAKFKDYKPSQLDDSKEAKVPSDPSPPTPPKKEDTEPVSSTEPKKPKVANASQSGARIFASPLARKLANDHNGDTFTVSNLGGTYGIKQFCAIINPPQLEYLPSDQVIKGAIGTEWLKAFKGYVENPKSMLL